MTAALARNASTELARLLRGEGVAYNMRDVTTAIDTQGIYRQWPSLASGMRPTSTGETMMPMWPTHQIKSVELFMIWYNVTLSALMLRKPAGWNPTLLAYESKAFLPRSARLFYSQPAGWPDHADDSAYMFAVEAAYHLRYARHDIELVAGDGGIAAYYHKLPIAGVRRDGVLMQGQVHRLANTSTLEYVTNTPRGHALSSTDTSLLARSKIHLQAQLTRASMETLDQINDLLDMVWFYSLDREGYGETFLTMLSTECAATRAYLAERDQLAKVIADWPTLGETDLQRFGQAMLLACPRPISPTKFNTRVLNILKQAGKEPTTEQAERGYRNLRELYLEHCEHYGLPEVQPIPQ